MTMSSLAVPTATSIRKKAPARVWLVVPAVVIVAALAYWGLARSGGGGGGPIAGQYHTVQPTDLMVKITKDGELQSISNIEIRNRVEGNSTILSIVPEGTRVTAGDT